MRTARQRFGGRQFAKPADEKTSANRAESQPNSVEVFSFSAVLLFDHYFG